MVIKTLTRQLTPLVKIINAKYFVIAVDDVVQYKFGEKSSRVLNSSGFGDVTFKSYAG